MLLNGSFAVKLEIHINALKLKFSGIANSFAKVNEIRDTKIVINPKIIFIPKNGLANMFDIKNVIEIELNLYAISGIIAIWADIVTKRILEIFSFIFILLKNFSTVLLKQIIPSVPKYDNCKPISLIENGFITNIINSEIDILV